MVATFHNHSRWSDGRATVGEMYAYAERVGVDVLGISDHFCVYPDGTSPTWSVPPGQVGDYLKEVLAFRDRGTMEIRVGLEFDWFEVHGPTIAPFIAKFPLDYRIGAVHHVEHQPFDVDPSFWTRKSTAERDEVFVRYWGLVKQMAESGLFDIAAHLDLPKKFGFYPSSDIAPAIARALDAIANSRMVVEVNTAGFGRACADSYPSLDILRQCRARDIPVTLSSDGHLPEHLLFEFARGVEQLKNAGFERVTRFRERHRWFEPLSDALKSGRR